MSLSALKNAIPKKIKELFKSSFDEVISLNNNESLAFFSISEKRRVSVGVDEFNTDRIPTMVTNSCKINSNLYSQVKVVDVSDSLSFLQALNIIASSNKSMIVLKIKHSYELKDVTISNNEINGIGVGTNHVIFSFSQLYFIYNFFSDFNKNIKEDLSYVFFNCKRQILISYLINHKYFNRLIGESNNTPQSLILLMDLHKKKFHAFDLVNEQMVFF